MNSEQRAFVRAHHPDVGGDPAEFIAGLARLRAQASPPRPDRFDAPVVFVPARRGLSGVLHHLRERRRRKPRVQ
ncbi:hypothetical protein [Amycolatopsis suaedae]|uniref:Uncharacterized protein n=1 Tax=Amycolatopsis suaedae TaxID=2510978 RepID=A0A4Q7J4X7_9PSEU|nr:hypothetical protein [Amycolatopsis suaedae]RZQ61353.1 hypothetical protein EWH70_23435 [Amycolatopsis suaedae]